MRTGRSVPQEGSPKAAPSTAVGVRPTESRQETLRRITREVATTDDLPAMLQSIVTALVEHTGVLFSRIWLVQSDEQCDLCRTQGPVGEMRSGGQRALHLMASAGVMRPLDAS